MRISQNSVNQPKLSTSQPKSNTQFKASFKGASIIGLMDSIERGGLFASFTIQDMLGTNIPRPVMGLMRNKKENKGKSNKTFALKEAIREFTTGPSMFIIPGTMIAVTKRLIGKSITIPAGHIDSLREIFKESINEKNIANGELKNDYYVNAFKKILSHSTGKEEVVFEEEAKSFADQLASLGEKTKRNPIEQMLNKKYEGSIDEAIDKMAKKFENISKSHADDVTVNFTRGKLSKTGEKEAFTKILGYISDFGDDAIAVAKKEIPAGTEKGFKELANKVIDGFSNKRIISRFGLNIAMSTAVISFLACIPKLYNISKKNPGLIGLEPETNTATTQVATTAEKNSQEKKGEVANASK